MNRHKARPVKGGSQDDARLEEEHYLEEFGFGIMDEVHQETIPKREMEPLESGYSGYRAHLDLKARYCDYSHHPLWNGPQVNRLKFIKLAGYGRAKFDLLRQRVLAA